MKRFKNPVLLILPLMVAMILLSACAAAPTNQPFRLNMEPFLQMAENAACADLRNQLYVIDDQFVFWASEGQCNDAGYAYILYGATPDEILCSLEDSIIGPSSSCQPELEALFETIQQNLDHPNLGLDENHSVIEVMPGEK